ncbi:MAG: Urease accessory protein UreF [Chroococcopsis gigantea SAG 12.99]|jgi:urease accessory protein|nr:urease accessory protein UreF [Chlorogloea purpurea SAG 13.99]MDV3001653.1 Urease accessory protein UreF [Chroococcopsis gigantea SAG 12.99]
MIESQQLLYLLQLVSPTLPVGAYSYSEGLETLVEQKIIHDGDTLSHWLSQSLSCGSVRVETAIMLRAYREFSIGNFDRITFWNNWLSASRETTELRQQSWQMGQSLGKLLLQLSPGLQATSLKSIFPCNYAIVFGIAAAHGGIKIDLATTGYLQAWTSNLINAAVRLIPLGQTTGQLILKELGPCLLSAGQDILTLDDGELASCNWGLSLASMQHEVQYSRLFRS